jgi:hypothetical protein
MPSLSIGAERKEEIVMGPDCIQELCHQQFSACNVLGL